MSNPTIVGHRGAAGLAPENSIAAFRLAYSIGVRWFELDVRLTRDGVPVVLHDPTVDRTTSGTGSVAALSLAELQSLVIDDAAACVPTLREALDCLPEDAYWLIELKQTEGQEARLAAAALAALRQARCRDRARVISFAPALLAAVRGQEPELPLGILTARDLEDALASAAAALKGARGCAAILPQAGMITPESVARCRAAGYLVAGWTANSAAAIRRLAAAGVDEIVTDFPDLALRVLG